ncbi:MAG: murein transglycosylase [Sphingomonas sp.]|nr:MAG: murein transglycosylase [Sphingomonas sp.]
MLRLVLLASLLASSALAARPAPHPLDCDSAIDAAERLGDTAPGLLHAIGVVESGRRDPRTGTRRPWPWTVSAEGVGTYYASRSEAVAAVNTLRARGVTSIDVGCMQVNLFYHPTAFATLEDAFDPALNARYAARFLRSLYGRLHDWPAAAAAYHSFTPGPAAQYAKLISAVWAGAPVPVVQAPDGREIVELPGGGELRIFRTASDTGRSRIFGVMN